MNTRRTIYWLVYFANIGTNHTCLGSILVYTSLYIRVSTSFSCSYGMRKADETRSESVQHHSTYEKAAPEKARNNLSISLYNPRTLHWSVSFRICAWNGIYGSFLPKSRDCINIQYNWKVKVVIVACLSCNVDLFRVIFLLAKKYTWGIVLLHSNKRAYPP